MTDIDYFRALVIGYAAGGNNPIDVLQMAKTTIELELEEYTEWLEWLEQQGADNGD